MPKFNVLGKTRKEQLYSTPSSKSQCFLEGSLARLVPDNITKANLSHRAFDDGRNARDKRCVDNDNQEVIVEDMERK